MPDVFVSYQRKDWAIAKALVEELQARGYDVWWDRDLVGGATFENKIAEALEAARAVIVIWSAHAVKADWVVNEASEALRQRKLIPTRLPDFRYNQIPEKFQNQQTETVDDLDKIMMALAGFGIQASEDERLSRPEAGNRLQKAVQQHRKSAKAQVTFFLPVMIFFVAMVLGAGLVLAANAIGVGWVAWKPVGASTGQLVKEIGYIPALNWSFASVALFPLIWALVALSFETLFDIRRKMVRNHMIVSTDFEPIMDDDVRFSKLFRDVYRMTFVMMVVITAFIIWFVLHDFQTVVGKVYADHQVAVSINDIGKDAIVPLYHHELERDWSIATFLDRADHNTTVRQANLWFAIAVHLLYPGLGVGIMFSFFLILVGIGMFFMPRAAGSYDLMVLPHLESDDKRCGFEVFAELFGHAVSIMALSFCSCYLMLLQNIYLRVETPTLAAFVLPDLSNAVIHFRQGNVGLALDDILGYAFAARVPYGAIQSVLAWFLGACMAVAFVGIAFLFLRASAKRGRKLVLDEMDEHGMSGLLKITDLPEAVVRDRLVHLEAWPLSWPKLNQMLYWYCLIFTGLVFYKLGLLFVVLTLIFVVYNTFSAVHDE